MEKVEDFFEEVRKAIVSIPKKPNFIMKDAEVVGIKLSSDMLDKLTKDYYSATEKDYRNVKLMGVKVYLDETVNRPKYIVEGEIMASFHPEALKGNSIKSYAIDEAVKPSSLLNNARVSEKVECSEAINSLEKFIKNELCELQLQYGIKEEDYQYKQVESHLKTIDTIKQALECWEIVKNKPFILQKLFENKGLENQQEYDKKYFWKTITEEEVAKVKEGLK